MVVAGWFVVLSGAADELQAERDREAGLKTDYRGKLAQAVNLTELRKQKLQVQEYVTQLEKQLPGKAEMDALLSDINQAGLGRGLQFELFRPGQVEVKDYYAELPITIRVTGRYHDIGSFAADVANLSRIVTLHNLQHRGAGERHKRQPRDGCHRAHLPLPRYRTRSTPNARPPRPRQREPRNDSTSRFALAAGRRGDPRSQSAAAPRTKNCKAGWSSSGARSSRTSRRWRRPRSSIPQPYASAQRSSLSATRS